MPLKASFWLIRPKHVLDARRAGPTSWRPCRPGAPDAPRIAGVHSIVWILAIRAALTSRATSKTAVVGPVGVLLPERVADRVVLAGEEGVQQAEAEPTSCR